MNRNELHNKSICQNTFCGNNNYKRIIILLVDALKYEFLDPRLKYSEQSLHTGNIPIIKNILINNNSFISHFISDPPTTTLQRLKALTTGSLPTFIDISRNFGSSELLEDNLVSQWVQNGYKVKFVGDDTWLSLFPTKFSVSHGYPSFDVKDLDSVDMGVREFVMEKLRSPRTVGSKEVIIGHMLGVDHCGHTFGKNHREMQRKLKELNDFIGQVVTAISGDLDSLLIVMGDHGMTPNGDHGGESKDEVDAGLLIVSGRPFTGFSSAQAHSAPKSIYQIDLVPTLAALTAVPIPFSNLGVLRPELLPSEAIADDYVNANFKQMSEYVHTYNIFMDLLGSLNPETAAIFSGAHTESITRVQKLAAMKDLQSHLRSRWAQFNEPLMLLGLLLCLLCSVNWVLPVTQPHIFFVLGVVAIICFSIIISPFIGIAFTVALLGPTIYKSLHVWLKLDSSTICFCLALTAVFSNSFIVWEDRVLLHILSVLLFICFLRSLLPVLLRRKRGTLWLPVFRHVSLLILGFILLNSSFLYRLCREEQLPHCYSPSTSSLLLLPLPITLALLLLFLRNSGNLPRVHAPSLLLKSSLFCGTAFLFFFQLLQFRPEPHLTSSLLLTLPRLVLVSCLVACSTLLLRPLLIQTSEPTSTPTSSHIPHIFKQLRESHNPNQPTTITVQGLATALSATVFSLIFTGFLVIATFSKLEFILGLVCPFLFLAVYSMLSLRFDKEDVEDVAPYKWLPPVSELAIVLCLVSHLLFLSTGHQPTISQLPWYAAFIGRQGHHTSLVLPAAMVLLNMFGPSLLLTVLGLLIPVIVASLSRSPANPLTAAGTLRGIGDFALFKTDKAADSFLRWSWSLLTRYLALHSCLTLSSMLSSCLHRRHLMAWKIFVPRMLHGVVHLFVVHLSALVAFLLLRRIIHAACSWRRKHI